MLLLRPHSATLFLRAAAVPMRAPASHILLRSTGALQMRANSTQKPAASPLSSLPASRCAIANGPVSTLPGALELPVDNRTPEVSSQVKYLFHAGKAYVRAPLPPRAVR